MAQSVTAGCLFLVCLTSAHAQPRAVLLDGDGPWSDVQWTFTVSQFSGLLRDAGYSVRMVSPADLPGALGNPEILVAVPSLESLPFECLTAIVNHINSGGSLMASGGEPFRNPLYRTADDRWLDATAYLQAVGSPPPQGAFRVPFLSTLSPSKEQYTAKSGVRVPVAKGRGIFSNPYSGERYRVIGDLLLPAATMYVASVFSSTPGSFTAGHSLIVWIPWPQIADPLRAQLVSALQSAPNRLYLTAAGADQMVWLPGEAITGGATVLNAAASAVEANLQWSMEGPTGVTVQPAVTLNLGAGEFGNVPLQMGSLPNGDYTLHFRLTIGNQEVDRVDSPVRVLDPVLTRQPDQKIRVVDGAFSAGGRHVFLRGVNYWPRFIPGISAVAFNGRSWLEADEYDPDLIEADLTAIEGLGFNLVSIQFSDLEGFWAQEGRALIDFLERCRNHGIWVQVSLHATLTNAAYAGQISPALESYLQAAFLPGNDRVFAYDLFWEPMIGTHDQGGQGRLVNGGIVYNTGRMVLDAEWRAWVNEQYGSVAKAEQAWGFTAPLDGRGQLTNPLDDQIQNDGPWRIMVAAYRRFLDDYLGRNLGLIARRIRRTDPDTLLTYRNWTTMSSGHNSDTGYDIGAGAAHLDFLSPERYSPVLAWPDQRAYGFVTAYSRYMSGGKPVVWAEYGSDIGDNGGTPASREAQAGACDTMMRLVSDDGSNGASVWWWPGGYGPIDGKDFGIIDPDGTPRACANTLAQWNGSFAASAPDLTADPPATLTVDRDADARGSYGLFLNNQDRYVQTRQAGQPVVLADDGTGADTATMPAIQAGNVPYDGSGPLKFANAELAGIHVVCPSVDATVENGSTVTVPSGASCQLTPMVVNTGEAQWLPGSARDRGVILHTSAGDIALAEALAPLRGTSMGPLTVATGRNATALTGRLKIVGLGDFGETLNLTLVEDSSVTGGCAIGVSPAAAISVSSAGTMGTIKITAADRCAWTASADQPWVTFGPDAGAGNGTVAYTVEANYGPKRQATMRIANAAFTVTEDGNSSASQVQAPTLSTARLDFGNQAVGASGAAQTVQLTNTGPGVLRLLAVSTGGLNGADFAEASTCGPTLAVGEGCTIRVSFVPTAAGLRTALLFIAGNISGGGSSISLSGTGVGSGPTVGDDRR